MALLKLNGEEEELELGLGLVSLTHGLGRKRILFSSVKIPVTESSSSPLKRQRNRANVSPLESLPQELLIEVIKCVDHEDLISLYLVSKSIKEASLIAKESYFAFNTPKKIQAFRYPVEFVDPSQQEEDLEVPDAPRHYRWTKEERKEQLSSISVALFT